jgi:hypothetical protein
MGGLELAGRIGEQRVTDEGALVGPEAPEADRGLVAPEDAAAFQDRFLRLLERHTAIYTMGDSTSVPKHVAADLLRSVAFVLGIDLEHPEIPERLLNVDLEDEFRRNLAEIGRKVELSGELWREVVATIPPIPSTALRDTIAAIGDFPRQYDFRSMAHEIPIVFDYPLCHPVPETLLGVDYINEYLMRLLGEADFLRRFDVDACVRVLECSSPDFEDLLVNLYEPVATNAIGRALTGEDPRLLRISDETRAGIASRLGPLTGAQRERKLGEAVSVMCDSLGIRDGDGVEYLLALVPELLPRIDVGLAHGDLRGVFVG